MHRFEVKEIEIKEGKVIEFLSGEEKKYAVVLQYNEKFDKRIKVIEIKQFEKETETTMNFFEFEGNMVGVDTSKTFYIKKEQVLEVIGEMSNYTFSQVYIKSCDAIARREIVKFEMNGETLYGLNMQNWLGNRVSPVIQVLLIQEFEEMEEDVIPFFEFEGKVIGVDSISYITIDTKRITGRFGFLPKNIQSTIDVAIKKEADTVLDEATDENTYHGLKIGMVNFGEKEQGIHEQGGYRPAVIFKQKGTKMLIAPLSRQVNKMMNDEIQIILHAGEGNIMDTCMVLNEQKTTVEIEKNKKITIIGVIPKGKSQQISKGRYKSIEILPLFEDEKVTQSI